MSGGYLGKILEVDLSTGSIITHPLDLDLAHKYLGGRGLATKILWDMAKPGIEPLDPDSPLLILSGPLTGLAPGGAQVCLVFKSPQTEITIGHPLIGTHWGAELKFAGYDGLAIHGQADKPVYLSIQDEDVQIRDAATLWGKGTVETEARLKEELGPLSRVLCIGPAGENQVRFASAHSEYFHAASRGGAGCLMGSKKLKAIVIRGSQGISVHEPRQFRQIRSEIEETLRQGRKRTDWGYRLARFGTSIGTVSQSDSSYLDVKNYREGYWPEVGSSGGLEFERRCRVKARGCFACPISCMQIGVIREGPYAGHTLGPDFDSTACIGPGCLVTDLYGLMYLNRLADDLGLDSASVGNVTGFTMECYERGLLSRSDLDGIDLTWGNVSAMLELWKKIIKGEGIGGLLAKGVKKASEEIGQGSDKFAMHAKGLEFAGYAAQFHHDRALQYALGDRGGCHHYGLSIVEQNTRAWCDSLGICTFHLVVPVFAQPGQYLDLLNAATGWDFSLQDWNEVAERILILARVYNLREGMIPLRDDVLPERFHSDAFTQGPRKGAYYPREKFERERAEWYQERGCDERGIPTVEHLTKLGLEFVIPTLQNSGLRSQTVRD